MSELMIAATNSAAPAAPANNAQPKQAAEGKPAAVKAVSVQTTEKPTQKQQQQQGNPWLSMLPFILIFVVMIFFMNRSQKKAMAKRQEMLDKIAKGTKVLLTSGIYGTVDAVYDDSMIVEIASGVKITVAKNGISGLAQNEESGKSEGK